MASSEPVIVWFRRDLRLADNPALTEAANEGQPVIPLFIYEDDAPRPFGAAQRWWLHYSLKALARRLLALGTPLVLRRGRASDVLPRLAAETGATQVMWNRRAEPREAAIDTAVARALSAQGVRIETFNTAFLFDPDSVLTRSGRPYRMFTPFWRHCLTRPEPPRPLPAPDCLMGKEGIASDSLCSWELLPHMLEWVTGMDSTWTPGEDAGMARLVDFLDEGLIHYAKRCERLPDHGTSRLSPHIAFGEISPRQIWHACRALDAPPDNGFLRELGWREFFLHTLARCPDLAERPLKPEFESFPWMDDEISWARFIAGRTGYPIVDAGMRALWETGWMHNRVRMIVSSFLVKDLLIPWQKGEAWFWDTLVDADPACNAGNWQWVAGCGTDAAPYFRILNPVLQGEKFDPRGHYVRRWVPEIARLPDAWVHHPWEAPPAVLAEAGLNLRDDYVEPIVDHGFARRRALAAFHGMRFSRDVPRREPAPDKACPPRHW